VAGNLQGALLNSGQVCAAHTRFFVDARRVDEFRSGAHAAPARRRPAPCDAWHPPARLNLAGQANWPTCGR
jgi:aldehyde dehydrogenase (NAD+)/betaine-aldehyde dehydrogenase